MDEHRKYLLGKLWHPSPFFPYDRWYPSIKNWPVNIIEMYKHTENWDLNEAVRLQKYIDHPKQYVLRRKKDERFCDNITTTRNMASQCCYVTDLTLKSNGLCFLHEESVKDIKDAIYENGKLLDTFDLLEISLSPAKI